MALEFVSGLIVPSLLQEFVDRIKASAADTIAMAFSLDSEKELKSLEASYLKAQSVLNHVDGWDLITSKPHRDWVADVRRTCYAAEDFSEHLSLVIFKKGDNGLLKTYWTRWDVSSKIHELQSNLNHLEILSNLMIASSCKTDGRHLVLNSEPAIMPDDESFRRKNEKENIVQGLLHPSSSSSVVLITGMFGLGKTTLAQKVVTDSRIQDYFDHRLWVSVSGDFNFRSALCSMIIDLQVEGKHELDSKLSLLFCGQQFRSMFQSLCKKEYVRIFQGLCKDRKFLVVLDDVCNFVKPQDWEDFLSVIVLSSMFSVLITTRNPKVAAVVASVSRIRTVSHYLQRMSDEDCGLILQKKAFPAGVINPIKRKHCGRSTSEVLALQISEKFCSGLPSVANIIGHHLSMKQLKQDDRRPVELSEDLWEMPEFKELIFPSFRLNYAHLSLFLKNSFPYFSLFPYGYKFQKVELIRLWLAEGYVKPQVAEIRQPENSNLEKRGEYFFDEVLSHSILQIYHPFDQDPQIYQMHEFIHRYAQCIGLDLYVQLDEQFVDACSSCNANGMVASAETTKLRNARHLSLLHSSIPPQIWKDIERHCEGLRTILSLQEHMCIGQVSYTLFLKLQSLRVLNLSGTDLSDLPETLGKLEHLRLLDVSKTDIQELPAATADLLELQFLKVYQCPLLHLPKNMKNLTRLLHLEADIKGLSSMPPDIGKLTNLLTLPAFIVDSQDGYRVIELKNMKHLQGSLCLTNLENVEDGVEAKGAMLRNKPNLEILELEWNGYLPDQSVAEKILAGFEPHENLQELQVTGYGGARFPNWLSRPECNLTSIHLLRCDRCSILPELWPLQNLKALRVEEMHAVEYIDDKFSGSSLIAGFASLECLKFLDMVSLKTWFGLQPNQMPRLRELEITDCPNLVSLPSLNLLSSLENLEISYCPLLQALPEQGMPASLQTLIIVKCDMLKERCLPQGSEWEKIKEVPNVVIDFVNISALKQAV